MSDPSLSDGSRLPSIRSFYFVIWKEPSRNHEAISSRDLARCVYRQKRNGGPCFRHKIYPLVGAQDGDGTAIRLSRVGPQN